MTEAEVQFRRTADTTVAVEGAGSGGWSRGRRCGEGGRGALVCHRRIVIFFFFPF
jgi:hypothetical protein